MRGKEKRFLHCASANKLWRMGSRRTSEDFRGSTPEEKKHEGIKAAMCLEQEQSLLTEPESSQVGEQATT